MKIGIKKKWNSRSEQVCLNNLRKTRELIESHMWCPPERVSKGVRICCLCGGSVNLDVHESSYYAVWVGLVCNECSQLYGKEIEELSHL